MPTLEMALALEAIKRSRRAFLPGGLHEQPVFVLTSARCSPCLYQKWCRDSSSLFPFDFAVLSILFFLLNTYLLFKLLFQVGFTRFTLFLKQPFASITAHYLSFFPVEIVYFFSSQYPKSTLILDLFLPSFGRVAYALV
jgi:hypothetical protein